MVILKIVLVLLGVLFFTGCSSSYKDFKTSDSEPGDGVVIGKVNVIYNGVNKNEDCAVCFNAINGPCQNLTKEGFVFKNIPHGTAKFSRVACKDTSMQHYNIDGAIFQVVEGVNYFGQVDIGWTNAGGFKASDLFGAVGAAITDSRNDGEVRLLVTQASKADVVKAYEEQTKQKVSQLHQSLVGPSQ